MAKPVNGIVHHTQWDAYRSAVNNYHLSVGKQKIIWRKMIANVDRFGEGFTEKYEEIELEVLMGYNDMRTWPTDRIDQPGIRDKENLWLYLNRKHLGDQGFLNDRGYLDFNPGRDRFLVQGIEYKPGGDVASAQAEANPLYILLILEREETETGNPLR